jgi:diacylglycerol O-acyltransferase / wax synthase
MTDEGAAHRFAALPAGAVVRPLSFEDLSILALETETVAGHTCKVVILDGQIDPDRLRETIADRLDRAPELRLCLQNVGGDPCWAYAAKLDLHAHVAVRDPGVQIDDAELRSMVAGLFEQRLDRSRPLWQMDVVPGVAGDRSAVIWRIHHALADGSTIMRLASAVLWDEELETSTGTGKGPVAGVHAGGESSRGHAPWAIGSVLREAPWLWHRSPFDGQIGAQRSVAFATAGLNDLRRVAAATDGATINDAVLSVVAGGLRRWLEAGHGHLGSVRVKIPVSLHHTVVGSGDDRHEPGNRDSFFCVELPLGSADPIDRLRAIRHATRRRKDGHDAEHLDALMRELGHASPRLRSFANRALAHPRSFALTVSNVAGPRRPVHVLGLAVQSFHSIAEIRERHALRVAAMSLADTISFGLCADPTLIPGVDLLAEQMQEEAAVMTGWARTERI